MLVVDAKAFTLDYLRDSIQVALEAHELKMLDLDTEFTDEEVKRFIVDLRKKTVTRSSLDVVPEEILKMFCKIDAGEREKGVLFTKSVNFLIPLQAWISL
jgi:hypothetical protein